MESPSVALAEALADVEVLADADTDALAELEALDDAEGEAVAEDAVEGDADALDEAEDDAVADTVVVAEPDADAEAVADETAGISQSLSRIEPPAGQFSPAYPGKGGMMSPQPFVGYRPPVWPSWPLITASCEMVIRT